MGACFLTQLQPRSPKAVKRHVQSHAAALGFTRRNPIIRAECQTPLVFPCISFARHEHLPLASLPIRLLADVHMSV